MNMKKIYMSEKNYTELNLSGHILARKYNYEKLLMKNEEIICRKYTFEITDEKNEDGLYKIEKKFIEDVIIVKKD